MPLNATLLLMVVSTTLAAGVTGLAGPFAWLPVLLERWTEVLR